MLREEFQAIDSDNNGKISFDELKTILSDHMSIQDFKDLMKILRAMIDSNKN
jgi:Ca2+-binding EF-hand superfamily protein